MRIALLTDGIYPYVMGGMQKHSYYLAKYLARNGVFIDLYHTGNREAAKLPLRQFSEEELAFISPFYIPFPTASKLPGHYVLESYLYSVRVYELLKQRKPVDFIYAQGFTGWKTITEKKKGMLLPPIAVNFHGVEMFQRAPNFNVKLQHLLLRLPVQFNIKNTDYVFSLGGKLTGIQKALTPKKVLEIPIGIQPNWLSRNLQNKKDIVRKFIFIGRYERRKGIEELQEVIINLSQRYTFHLSLIGPIPTEKQLDNEQVDYLGLIRDEAKIKKILQDWDVLVCPSYAEGMPTVILEAMASGLAVIATDVGAVNTLVSTKNGWLIPATDKAALRKAIVGAINLSEAELYQKKAASLQLVKSSYTWDAIIKTTIDKISYIVNQSRL